MAVALDSREMAGAVRVWHRVFLSTDPFGWPFAPPLDCGRVLFPIDGCQLSREQFEALSRMAALAGETRCYLAVVEGSAVSGVTSNNDFFEVDLADYDGYARLHLTIENSLYSMDGSWGLMLSHEMHAVLGGSSDLVSEFNRFDGRGADEWRNFRAEWKAEDHAKWLAEIAAHLPN